MRFANILTLILFVSGFGYAGAQTTSAPQAGIQVDANGRTITQPVVTAPGTQGLQAAPTDMSNAPSAAKSSQASNIIGEVSSLAVAGYMATQCPTSTMACVMAAMSLAQAAQLATAAGGAGNTAAGLSSSGVAAPGTVSGAPTVTTAPTTTADGGSSAGAGVTTPPFASGALAQQYQVIGQNLSAKGVSLAADGQSVKLPDGSSVPTSALSSPGAMSASGMSAADIAHTQDMIAAAQAVAKDKVKAMGQLTADSNSGSGAAGGSDSDGNGGRGGMAGGAPWGGQKRPAAKGASVSGMSKKLGDDNIGVSGDDIFQMINRRYQARDAANAFLKN